MNERTASLGRRWGARPVHVSCPAGRIYEVQKVAAPAATTASTTLKLKAAAPLTPDSPSVGVATGAALGSTALVASTGAEVCDEAAQVVLLLLPDWPQTVSVWTIERVLVTVEVGRAVGETVASSQVCESWATAPAERAASAAAVMAKRIVIEFGTGMSIGTDMFMGILK